MALWGCGSWKPIEKSSSGNSEISGIFIVLYTLFECQLFAQNHSLESYYGELSRIEKDTEINTKIYDELWLSVVKDKNVSGYNYITDMNICYLLNGF